MGLINFVGKWSAVVDAPMHIRRCHVCGGITEVHNCKVLSCQHCGKSMSQFYYFDDSKTSIYGVDQLRFSPKQGEYNPIYGLTAYWDTR